MCILPLQESLFLQPSSKLRLKTSPTSLYQGFWRRKIIAFSLFQLTGLCKIWVTRFLCSIILKSCRRSGDMFLSLMYSGSFSLMRSKYLSLWGMLGGGGVVITPWLASELMLQACRFPLSVLIKTKDIHGKFVIKFKLYMGLVEVFPLSELLW